MVGVALKEYNIRLTKAQLSYLHCLILEYVHKQKVIGNLLVDIKPSELAEDYIGYLVHKFYPQAQIDVPEDIEISHTAYF